MRRLALLCSMLLLLGAAPTATAADAPGSCASAVSKSVGAWHSETIGSATDVDWFRFSLTSTRRVLVTLGRLPKNYSLALYSSCGTLLATSNRAATTYEEIDRSLAAGTYRVRVAGVGGATSSSPYSLRFRPLASGVVVLSSAAWKDGAGRLHIPGEVYNNTSSTRSGVRVTVNLIHADGGIQKTVTVATEVELLRPHARSPFHFIISAPPDYARLRYRVSSAATSAVPVKLTLTNRTAYRADDGSWHFPGSVRNPNSYTVRLIEVMLTLYNDRGGVFNTMTEPTTPATLISGATATFDLVPTERFIGANRYTTLAQGRR
ncbi:MAG TPA: hypothetical protein VFK38_07270 [Candidatus Limnocylindrales bacterium]|nr:hypothetical protein [Candidatus Limnocylindrales bacterium]